MACYRDDLHHLCRLTPKLAPCWFPWQEAIGRIVVFFRCKAGFSSLSFYLCLFLMCVFVRIVPLITAPSSAARYSMWPVWMSCRNSSPWTASRSQSASLGESPPPPRTLPHHLHLLKARIVFKMPSSSSCHLNSHLQT